MSSEEKTRSVSKKFDNFWDFFEWSGEQFPLPKDTVSSLEELEKEAKKKDIKEQAQLDLAMSYYHGIKTTKDVERAKKILKQIPNTNLNYSQGQYLLGCIARQQGKPKDAYNHFKKATKGHKMPVFPAALTALGITYVLGEGHKPSVTKGVDKLKQSDHFVSQICLALLYAGKPSFEEIGRDYQLAMEFIITAHGKLPSSLSPHQKDKVIADLFIYTIGQDLKGLRDNTVQTITLFRDLGDPVKGMALIQAYKSNQSMRDILTGSTVQEEVVKDRKKSEVMPESNASLVSSRGFLPKLSNNQISPPPPPPSSLTTDASTTSFIPGIPRPSFSDDEA